MKSKKENNIFLEVVGDTPKTRILDFLMTFSHFDYPKTEIARNSGVSYTNLELILPKLVNLELVRKTRKVGKSEMYQINKENPTTKILLKFHWAIIKSITSTEQGLELKEPIKIKVSI